MKLYVNTGQSHQESKRYLLQLLDLLTLYYRDSFAWKVHPTATFFCDFMANGSSVTMNETDTETHNAKGHL